MGVSTQPLPPPSLPTPRSWGTWPTASSYTYKINSLNTLRPPVRPRTRVTQSNMRPTKPIRFSQVSHLPDLPPLWNLPNQCHSPCSNLIIGASNFHCISLTTWPLELHATQVVQVAQFRMINSSNQLCWPTHNSPFPFLNRYGYERWESIRVVLYCSSNRSLTELMWRHKCTCRNWGLQGTID